MKTHEAVDILKEYNEWRRGADMEMTDPKKLGQAIDTAIKALEWQPIYTAPKDGTQILVKFKDSLPDARDDIKHIAGTFSVLHHGGILGNGFDLGWHLSNSPYGGRPDHWIAGWRKVND